MKLNDFLAMMLNCKRTQKKLTFYLLLMFARSIGTKHKTGV